MYLIHLRRIYNPVKYLRWSFLLKNVSYFCTKYSIIDVYQDPKQFLCRSRRRECFRLSINRNSLSCNSSRPHHVKSIVFDVSINRNSLSCNSSRSQRVKSIVFDVSINRNSLSCNSSRSQRVKSIVFDVSINRNILSCNSSRSHRVKSIRIPSFLGPYFPAFGLHAEIYRLSPNAGKCGPKNTEYGHFIICPLFL